MQVGPENLGEFLPAHKFPWGVEQTVENLKRLLLQFNAQSELTQLTFPEVHLEDTEPNLHGNHNTT
jgi:hypothetical protein